MEGPGKRNKSIFPVSDSQNVSAAGDCEFENQEAMEDSGSMYLTSTHVSAPFNHKAPLVCFVEWEATNGMPPYRAMRSSISN